MEIAILGAAPAGVKNNAPAWSILYTIIVFARCDPPGNMDARRGGREREAGREMVCVGG